MRRSRIFLISSMVIFGTIGLFVRNIDLSPGEIALYRSVLAIALVGIFILLSPSRRKPPTAALKRALPLLFLSGGAMGFNWVLLFEAYKHTTVSNATLAYYFAPVIVTVASAVLFKERSGLRGIVCFLVSTLGVVMITATGGSGENHLLGITFGLCAAALYASVVLINKFIKDIDGIWRTFLQFISAALVLLPYVALTSGFNLGALDLEGGLSLALLGLLHTGFTYCMYFSLIKDLRGQEVAVLSYIDPLVAVIVSVAILHEPLSLPQIIGGILILGAAIFNEIQPRPRKNK